MTVKTANKSLPKDLTPKQALFCKEYLIDLNATAAAKRAGYSEHTAKDIGCQNLAKPYIQERLQKEINERSKSTEITVEYVLNSLKDIAERCQQKKEFNPHAANKALELLGRHLQMFTDNVNHKFDLSFADIMKLVSGSNGHGRIPEGIITGRN